MIKVQRRQQHEQADGHIDVKNPAPAEKVCDNASDGRPGSYAQRYHYGIQAQGQSSLIGGKGTGNHRHVDRKDERASDPLEETSKNQQRQRRGQARKRGPKDENNQSRQENGLATKHIGKASKGEQKGGNHDQVANNDPLGGSAYPYIKCACNAG